MAASYANIAGVNLSKANHDRILNEAIKVARDSGYCDEAENILSQMGFIVPTNRVKVTIEVEVDLDGSDRADYDDRNFDYRWNVSHDLGEVEEWKVVKVEDLARND